MGRKTACSIEEWRTITKDIARGLSRKLRAQGVKRISLDEWRKKYAEALRLASELAIEDCDVSRIIDEVLRRV